MGKRILVSSNCQTDGIAEALKVMLPTHLIEIVAIPPQQKEWDYLIEPLKNGTDVLVSSDPICWSEAFLKEYGQLEVIAIPQLVFPAFYPDIVYAVDPNKKFIRCLDSDYHSAICLWSWKNGIGPENCVKLFTENTFYKSVDDLQAKFKEVKLDFGRFWRTVQRNPPFMFSVNHPNVLAISELSKQVAVKLGTDTSVYMQPIHRMLTDKLDALRWPIYPELGKLFGIPGMYKWKIRKAFYTSLEDYVKGAMKSYDDQKFKGDEINFFSEGYEQFDSILKDLKN